MSFVRRFFSGFRLFFQSLRYIPQHRMLRYVILPSFLSLATGVGLATVGYLGLHTALTDLLEQLNESAGLQGYLQSPLIGGLVVVLSVLVGGTIAVILWRLVASVVVLPFLGPLLEKIEEEVIGEALPTSWNENVRNTLIGLWTGVKHLVAGVLILAVSWPLGPIGAALNIMAQSYFSGRGVFDLLFEKHTPSMADRRTQIKRFRPELFGVGLAFFLTLFIPGIGVLAAPVLGVTAAARIYYGARSAPVRKAGQKLR